MTEQFGDRLAVAVERSGSPVVVGLDPHLSLFPSPLRHLAASQRREIAAAAVQRLCDELLEAVADVVGVVKPQVAFFERLGPPGWAALEHVVRRARAHGLLVVADAKRGDIGSTAEAYAEYFFGAGPGLGGLDADAVTLNPYLGSDSLEPFVRHLERGKGFFLLAKTSNPGSAQLQELAVRGAGGDRPVYERVAALAAEIGSGAGASRRSPVGLVVGATAREQARALRRAFPGLPFLVPGYGAQGATAQDAAAAFDPEGRGTTIVNASRSILFAYREERHRDLPESRWAQASRRACCAMRDAILDAVTKARAEA